jgi:hypothetical protein
MVSWFLQLIEEINMAVVDQTVFASPNALAQRRGIKNSMMRHWLHHRHENGLARCCLKIGRALLIDEAQFMEWLQQYREEKNA